MSSMSISTHNLLSGSIHRHETRMQHESIATTLESFQEFAHPNDVAAMQAESPAALKHLQDTQPVFLTLNHGPKWTQANTILYWKAPHGPTLHKEHLPPPKWIIPATHTLLLPMPFLLPVSDPDAIMTLSDGSNLEASFSTSNETMHALCSSCVLGKHKAWQTKDSSSDSPLLPCKCRGFHQDDNDEIKEGKFVVYRLANISAMVMTIHNPKLVDI
ncbi:hypothetical protein EDD22DRAFT_841901 [Suillus occidentalis]|nr:hypothetical protein EDD22DRAFT_841901 [Suillus occidentalis]